MPMLLSRQQEQMVGSSCCQHSHSRALPIQYLSIADDRVGYNTAAQVFAPISRKLNAHSRSPV
jgi:hypothetical protein